MAKRGAIPSIPRLKGDPKYKDAPRFKLIYSYEGQMKDDHKKTVSNIVRMTGIKMSQMLGIK